MNFKACILIITSLLISIVANATELSDKLRSSDHVLLMRHALAPGIGDPANYKLNDCSTQRNLSDAGRAQARTVGHWLKAQGVETAAIFSSAWCRCKETAELLRFGTVHVEPSLASFFDEMHKARERSHALQHFIAQQLKTKGNKALILVTHHVNIYEFMGENIDSGDMVLAQVDAAGKMISYQRIRRPN
jgi:phosphohistidine phosphatase SixA